VGRSFLEGGSEIERKMKKGLGDKEKGMEEEDLLFFLGL